MTCTVPAPPASGPPPPPALPSRRLLLVLAALAALGAGLTGPTPPTVQSDVAQWVLPAQREAEVLRWLGPLSDGAQLTAAWRVTDVALAANLLRLHLRDASTRQEYWLGLEVTGQPAVLTLKIPPELPAEPRRAAQSAAAALPLPGPFVVRQPATRLAPLIAWPTLAAAYATLRFFSLLCLLLALAWAWQRLDSRQRRAYGLLTLGAGLLRAWLSPATFLHELYHVDESLSALSGQPGFFNGYGGPALYSALVPWLALDPRWMFAVNAIASTLTVPALARLAAVAWRDERAGLAAGLLLALSPLHLRWGAAEDQWILGTGWAVLALASWLAALSHRDALALAIALLATVLAAQARSELLLLPLVLSALALVRLPRQPGRWLSLPLLGLLGGAAVAASWPLALLFWHRPQPPTADFAALARVHESALWLDERWTPLPVLWLSLMAATLALFAGRGAVLVILAAAVMWIAVPLLFYGSPGPFLQRTQLLSGALLLAVAAGALPLTLPHLPPRLWAAGLALALLVAVHDRRPAIVAQFAQQAEWEFLRDQVPRLPRLQRLVAMAGTSADRFPIGLFAPAQQPTVLNQEEIVDNGTWPAPGRDLFYYQSMACWFADHRGAPPPGGQHPRCQAVADRYQLEPLALRTLPVPGDEPLWHAKKRDFPVGFYRLSAWRTVSP